MVTFSQNTSNINALLIALLLLLLVSHTSSFILPKPFSLRQSHLPVKNHRSFYTSVALVEGISCSCGVNESKLTKWSLSSSFYDDFEDFNKDGDDDDEDDDDDDDDDEYIDFDETAVANFRSKMGVVDDESKDESNTDIDSPQSDLSSISSVDDLIRLATGSESEKATTEWAVPLDMEDMSKFLTGGVVLVANPEKFCDDFDLTERPNPALLTKFGFTFPPPPDLGPDRRADLMPVLLLLERHSLRGCQALLLNRRTGYLMGDLDQQQAQEDSLGGGKSPIPLSSQLGAFMIQPLWFGGTSSRGLQVGGGSNRGLDMIHLCPKVIGAKPLTEDGLFWGGDPAQAQEAMNDPNLERPMTGFDFKFFVQSTSWLPTQLEKEIRRGTWFAASVSKEVLFKSRDRLGAKRAKPLWTEIMELMGGDYKDIMDQFYDNK